VEVEVCCEKVYAASHITPLSIQFKTLVR
jgi:hypothetical protein